MAKGAECYRGISKGGLVGEHHLEDGNIADDGGGDGGNEEEDGCDEEEDDADPGESIRELFLDYG